jgi:hypothetical protein
MNVYDTITQQIITQLEHGTVPWRSCGVPRNLLSLKPYRGINVWLLLSHLYTSPYWVTFQQAQEIGGTIRKGEKGTTVVFWKFADEERHEEREQQGSRPSTAPLVRTYTVFNSEQCTLPESLTERIAATIGDMPEPISECEKVIANMPTVRRLHMEEIGPSTIRRSTRCVFRTVPSLFREKSIMPRFTMSLPTAPAPRLVSHVPASLTRPLSPVTNGVRKNSSRSLGSLRSCVVLGHF